MGSRHLIITPSFDVKIAARETHTNIIVRQYCPLVESMD